MISESGSESFSSATARPCRPAIYPLFVLPWRIANVAGAVLVGSAALAIVGAAIEAVSYHQPSASQEGLVVPNNRFFQFGQQVTNFADRLALFTRGGATLDVATLLVVAVGVVAMAARGIESDEEFFGWWRLVLTMGAVLASMVALANLGMCVEVVRNAGGQSIGEDSANKLSSVVGFLAPTSLSVGVVGYTIFRLRASRLTDTHFDELESEESGDSPPSEPGR